MLSVGILIHHSDSSLKLCSDLRFGARIGYDGPRMSKFSTIVALGHTAGPFTNPSLANLQVSQIGIVPRMVPATANSVTSVSVLGAIGL
jgi:hypothetical protein